MEKKIFSMIGWFGVNQPCSITTHDCVFIIKCNWFVTGKHYLNIELTSNSPAVQDANITFTARLSYASGAVPTGLYYAKFEDRWGTYSVRPIMTTP